MNNNIIQTTTEAFAGDVLTAELPVLVDFYATWCPPCRVLAPILDELAAEFVGQVQIFKVNVDDAPELAIDHRIQGIPTLVFFRDGREVDRLVGAAGADVLRAKLRAISAAVIDG